MIPPLWPWKVIMLPARGPRPALKGETALSLRLMDDVDIPQVAQTYGPSWHFFGRYQNDSFHDGNASVQMQLSVRPVGLVSESYDADGPAMQPASQNLPQASYASLATRSLQPTQAGAAPGMPVFVLTNGTVLSVSGYGYTDSRISYSLIGGGSGVISTDEVDWATTTRLNAQRGVRVTLHSGRTTSEAAGF
jgi:hypothetical protein